MNHYIFGSFLWAVAFLATPSVYGQSKDYYPHCSPIAHEIQQAWHRGEIKTEEAGRLIQRCMAAEECGVFIR